MTSTRFNVGLNEGRASSRVLRPPGGGHTDIFGGEVEPPRQRGRGRPQAAVAAATATSLGEERPTNGINHNAKPQDAQEAATPPDVSEQSETPYIEPVNGGSPRKETYVEHSNGDVGEPKNITSHIEPPEVKAEPPKAEPPKRVRVPPGGFSSGLW